MFLGLDLSLDSSGFVIIDDGYNIIDRRVLHVEARDTERLIFLEEEFLNAINPFKDKIKLVAYESPAYRGEGKLVEIGEWLGQVKVNISRLGLKIIKVAPNQLKKYVIGHGSGGKDLIMLDVFKNFGVEIRQNDEADAYVVARIAHDYYMMFLDKKPVLVTLTRPQTEVLNKIYKTLNKGEII
ncbi:MAG TPA: hypothetical protein P5136_00485 [Methanofastidiosum sp.]|nr:hypothetical protein [Methanofastidiosum sp.]